jgi:hypothetical protein
MERRSVEARLLPALFTMERAAALVTCGDARGSAS